MRWRRTSRLEEAQSLPGTSNEGSNRLRGLLLHLQKALKCIVPGSEARLAIPILNGSQNHLGVLRVEGNIPQLWGKVATDHVQVAD